MTEEKKASHWKWFKSPIKTSEKKMIYTNTDRCIGCWVPGQLSLFCHSSSGIVSFKMNWIETWESAADLLNAISKETFDEAARSGAFQCDKLPEDVTNKYWYVIPSKRKALDSSPPSEDQKESQSDQKKTGPQAKRIKREAPKPEQAAAAAPEAAGPESRPPPVQPPVQVPARPGTPPRPRAPTPLPLPVPSIIVTASGPGSVACGRISMDSGSASVLSIGGTRGIFVNGRPVGTGQARSSDGGIALSSIPFLVSPALRFMQIGGNVYGV